jgi:hypothetical protein
MSVLINDTKATIIALVSIFGLLGYLQFVVWSSNTLHEVIENPDNATDKIPEIVERGTDEILSEIRGEIVIAIILAVSGILFALLKAIKY